MHPVRIITIIFCLLVSPALAWETYDELYAQASGADNMTLSTDLNKSVSSDGREKTFLATLLATGVKDITFSSSNYLTWADENGEQTTTGSTISQQLSLPEAFNVFMLHNQSMGATSTFPDAGVSWLSLYHPDSPGEEIFASQMSMDGDGFDADSIIDQALADSLGQGVAMDRIDNMVENIKFSHDYISSQHGVTCEWGESKNVAFRIV